MTDLKYLALKNNHNDFEIYAVNDLDGNDKFNGAIDLLYKVNGNQLTEVSRYAISRGQLKELVGNERFPKVGSALWAATRGENTLTKLQNKSLANLKAEGLDFENPTSISPQLKLLKQAQDEKLSPEERAQAIYDLDHSISLSHDGNNFFEAKLLELAIQDKNPEPLRLAALKTLIGGTQDLNSQIAQTSSPEEIRDYQAQINRFIDEIEKIVNNPSASSNLRQEAYLTLSSWNVFNYEQADKRLIDIIINGFDQYATEAPFWDTRMIITNLSFANYGPATNFLIKLSATSPSLGIRQEAIKALSNHQGALVTQTLNEHFNNAPNPKIKRAAKYALLRQSEAAFEKKLKALIKNQNGNLEKAARALFAEAIQDQKADFLGDILIYYFQKRFIDNAENRAKVDPDLATCILMALEFNRRRTSSVPLSLDKSTDARILRSYVDLFVDHQLQTSKDKYFKVLEKSGLYHPSEQ